MLMPIFGKDFFDDFFDAPRTPAPRADLMKTDLREDAEGYVLDIDMPGVRKEDMQAELKDGYLTVSAFPAASAATSTLARTLRRRTSRPALKTAF